MTVLEGILGDLSATQLIWAAVIIVAFGVAGRLISTFLSTTVHRMVSSSDTEIDDILLQGLKGPIIAAVFLLGFVVARGQLLFASPQFQSGLTTFLFVAYALTIYLFLYRLLNGVFSWYLHSHAAKTDTALDDHFVPFIRRISLIVLTAILAIVLLEYFELPISSFIATLGIGSLAIALAAQASLSDVISGILIITDRPFRIGDRVQIQGTDILGDVKDIGIRSTHILTLDHRMVVIPNSVVASNVIINEAYPDPSLRLDIPVGIAYGSDVGYVKKIMTNAVNSLQNFPMVRQPMVLFRGMGDSALNIEARIWIDVYENRELMLDRVNMAIYAALEEAGIEIPFPQQTVWHRVENGGQAEIKITPTQINGHHHPSPPSASV